MANKLIFMKTIECPICKKTTKQPALKSTGIKLLSQDFDLFTSYQDVEPLYYGTYFCNHCGYANLTQTFDNPTEKKYSYENLHNGVWKEKNIPEEYNIEDAIRNYKLVLLNKTTIEKQLSGEIGITCLKLYYLYKLKNDKENMERFRKLTLESLEKAYQTDEFPFAKSYNSSMISYLIAIFSYFEGDIDKSKQWISKVITNRATSIKLKEKARDFKDEYLK